MAEEYDGDDLADELVEDENIEEEEESEDEVDETSPDLTAHLPVTVIDATDENGNYLLDDFIRQALTGIVKMVNDYTSAHAAQTGQHSESFIAWRSNIPPMSEEEKKAKELTAMTALHDWLWTKATPSQLKDLLPLLDEMVLDINRALQNRKAGIENAERPEKIDLKAARETLVSNIDSTRGTARSNIFPAFTEDLILGLPEITLRARKNSPGGVYGFPSAPKVMSADQEKKKNGGKSFRSHNTRVRILVDGKLLPDHPGTLNGATTFYLNKSVQEAGKIFDEWKTGASWTDEKTGKVYTWCYQEDAPKVEPSAE